ncbi:hypothetical protein HOLleu_34308 [Holothuria leucospilota]|uniref:Ig-like domain-containing protein n=1 Tax=Holothuria leucospilota TaxID=206669 RepID=A0A9Q1BH26_HOLLE|nr:hypothetical protein HOLleu_34308 [Holothuria leucospilota]
MLISRVLPVPPTVWLEFNNSKVGNTLDVIMNEEYEIRCWAEGGRPHVTLYWEIDNKTVTEGTLQLQDDRSKISTVINYRPKLDETRLSCKTEGQRIIASIQSDVLLNVLYKPVCNLHFQRSDRRLNSYQIHCVCVANPDNSVVFLSVNDSMYMAKSEMVVKTNYSTTIFCKGKNIVGFSELAVTTIHPFRIIGEKEVLSVKPPQERKNIKTTGIIVVLIILGILVVSSLTVVLFSHWSRLNTEKQIRSRYFVADLNENGRGTISCRNRLPSPEDQRRVPVKKANNYHNRVI